MPANGAQKSPLPLVQYLFGAEARWIHRPDCGFQNAIVAIFIVSAIIFLLIYNQLLQQSLWLDIDLLTSRVWLSRLYITSLIYASFTFIFLALEATIMALA